MKQRNNNIGNVVFCVIALVMLFSCKKEFLEVTPKGKLIARTMSDYNLLLSNLDLLNMGAGFSGGADAQVAMSDEVAAVEPFFNGASLRTQRLFRRDDVLYEPNQDAMDMTTPMKNIYLYNTVINEVLQATDGTEAEKKQLQAEALAGRAWTYFLMINYFGKPYDEQTAASDPGFPIITAADVTETKFTRASVKDVYDFIINDLTTAIPGLPLQLTHRLRMSKPAAEALLGKVYMFMGKFNEALPLLNAAMSDLTAAAIPVSLYDYNLTFAPGGLFLPIGPFGPRYPLVPNNEENIYAKQFTNTWSFTSSELVLSPEAVALFGPSDLRLNFYKSEPFPAGPSYPLFMLRRIGPAGVQFGVVVPDLYLLSAECKARLSDLPGATADVEELRMKRMPADDAPVPAAISSDQLALTKFILEERTREFAMQGYRWFDMRRLSVDPELKTTINYTHSLYDASGNATTFTLKPERFVLRFPQKIIDQNPGMENNP